MYKINRLTTLIIGFTLFCLIGCKTDKKASIPKAKEAKKEIVTPIEQEKQDEPTILFYGNSLTAGFGLNENESFPSIIDDIITEKGLEYKVVNAGLSGETTAGGLKRIDWVLNQRVDVFVLELGANDMLRGLPLTETKSNLIGIVEKVKGKYPSAKIAIAEMYALPNMGADYVENFKNIYSQIANDQKISLIPFFLNGVAGYPDLNLPDGKHPNAEGQKIVAQNIWKGIEGLL